MPVTAPDFWHHHFGKTTAFWALAFLVPFARQLRPRHGGARSRAHAARGVRAVHHPAARAVHRRREEFTCAAICTARLRSTRHSGAWDGARERHGHDRGGDAADPPAAARERQSPASRARRDLLHLPGGEHRRRVDTAGRSAAVPGIPQGGRLLLDHEGDALADALASALLLASFTSSTLVLATRGRGRARGADPTPDRRFAIDGKINFLLLAGIVGCVLLSRRLEAGISSSSSATTRNCRASCATFRCWRSHGRPGV